MPFKPSTALIIAEVAFRKHLRAIAQNEEAIILALPEVTILIKNHKTKSDADKQSEFLLDFYTLIIDLINCSVMIKHRYLNNTLPYPMDRDLQTVRELQKKIIAFTTTLETQHPELWRYLLNNTSGRHALYYLIFSNIIHSNLWDIEDALEHWISALSKTGAHAEEVHVLAYLSYLLKLNNSIKKNTRTDVLINQQTTNPFLRAHMILNLPHHGEMLTFKIDEIKKLILSPLSFGPDTPSFIIHFIQIEFAHTALMHVTHHLNNIPEFLNIIQALSQAHYLPSIPKSIQGLTATHALSQICHLYEHIHVFSFYYTLHIDQDIIFIPWYHTLIHLHVYLYGHLQDIQISPEISLSLAISVSKLIKRNLVETDVKHSAPKQHFWQTVARIFLATGEVNKDFIQFFSTHLNPIIDHLFHQGMNDTVIKLLFRLFDYQKHVVTLSVEQYKQYGDLLAVLHFVHQLAKDKEDCPQHLNKLFKYIQETAPKFEQINLSSLTKDFSYLPTELKSSLLEQIKAIKATLSITKLSDKENDKRYQIQKSIFKLTNILAIEPDLLSQLKSDLGYDDYLSYQLTDLLKEDKKRVDDTKKKKTTASKKHAPAPAASAAVSSLSIFKPADLDNKIAQDKLPVALLELASAIKKMTQQALIITGGAVTSLFLDRGKPRDFDCLILDTDKEKLLEQLKAAGFVHCQLIGKHFPIIKLKLIEDGRSLEIDITTESTQGLPLHKAMEEILAKRDFKLSALYMVLSAGEKTFEVKGFAHSIRSVNNQLISVVKHRDTIFQEDPTRLLRLAKILLQYPDFHIDDKLALILRQTDLKTCFNDFLSQKEIAITNQGRLGTAIEALFARFEMHQVIQKLGELGAIEGMTGLSYPAIAPSLKVLDAYSNSIPYIKKMAFYQFVYIHHCLNHSDSQDLLNWPFYKVTRHLQPEHRIHFDLIEQQILKTKPHAFVVAPKVLEMIELIKNANQQASASAAAASSPGK